MTIKTTHAGSLPRPPSLQKLHADQAAGKPVDAAAMSREARRATVDVVNRQHAIGLDLINNGEVGRESFFSYVRYRMTGFSTKPGRRPPMADMFKYEGFLEQVRGSHFREHNVSLAAIPAATSAVSWDGDAAIGAEIDELQEVITDLNRAPGSCFMSSPSPGIVAAGMENRHYERLEDYVSAVAAALGHEYRAIAGAGFILQIDAPDLAMERHTLFHGKPLREFLAFIRLVVDAINKALIEIPKEQIRLHVCWGNYEGPHDEDVPLADILDEITRMRTGGLLLSMANPRHEHEYRLFEEHALADDLMLIPGVIDTTTNYIEHPEAIAGRIERIVEVVGDPKRVIAGTDCGFETSTGFGAIAPAVAWAKLESLVAGARLAAERLTT